jgi:hypothetical protein
MFTFGTTNKTIINRPINIQDITLQLFERNSVLVGINDQNKQFVSILMSEDGKVSGCSLCLTSQNTFTVFKINGVKEYVEQKTITTNSESYRIIQYVFDNIKLTSSSGTILCLKPFVINPTFYNLPIYDGTQLPKNGDYIDTIPIKSVLDRVMSGIDKYGRPFIVINFLVDSKMMFTQTFFQRYSSDELVWASGSCVGANKLIDTCGEITQLQHNFLADIIEGNIVVITEDLNPIDKKLIGKTVCSCVRV